MLALLSRLLRIVSAEAASASEGGERGIRTPGGVTLNGFQDHRIRPLCHLSKKIKERSCLYFRVANVKYFIIPQTTFRGFFCLYS